MTLRKKLNIVLLLIFGLYNLHCNGTVLIGEDDDESRVIPMGGISLMLWDTSAGNPELAQVLVNVQKVEVFRLENEEHEEHDKDHKDHEKISSEKDGMHEDKEKHSEDKESHDEKKYAETDKTHEDHEEDDDDEHEEEGHWISVADFGAAGKIVDLRQWQKGKPVSIGNFLLPLGNYDKVRIILNPDNQVGLLTNGQITLQSLLIPAQNQTGFTLNGNFTISQQNTVQVILDFNSEQSVSVDTAGNYLLNPVVSILSIGLVEGATQIISAAQGGQVTIANQITLDIPPGALPADTNISIIKTNDAVSSQTSDAFFIENYELLPDGLTFQQDVKITMSYDPAIATELNQAAGSDMLNDSMYKIAYYDPATNQYVKQPTTIDPVTNTISTNTTHFSVWTLIFDLIEWNVSVLETSKLAWVYEYADYKEIVINDRTPGPYYYWVGKPLNPYLLALSITEDVPGYASISFLYEYTRIYDPNYVIGGYLFFHDAQRHDKCDSMGYRSYGRLIQACNDLFIADMQARCNNISNSTIRSKCRSVKSTFEFWITATTWFPDTQNANAPYQTCERFDEPNQFINKDLRSDPVNDYYFCRHNVNISVRGLSTQTGTIGIQPPNDFPLYRQPPSGSPSVNALVVQADKMRSNGTLEAENVFSENSGFYGDVNNYSLGKFRGGQYYRLRITQQPPGKTCYFMDSLGLKVTSLQNRMDNNTDQFAAITCEANVTLLPPILHFRAINSCQQTVSFTDESLLLTWQYDITGLTTMPTFRITYVLNGQTNEVELYHGPAAVYGIPASGDNMLTYIAPISSHQSTIDNWAGRTVLYNIQAMMDGGISSDKSTVAVTYLSQYDLFKEDKSSMCYFWPDANTKTFYAY